VSLIIVSAGFALFIWRATDCLEDVSQSAIAHDGIFGFGDERQNILAEKEFEEAAAKGFRPCTSTNYQPFPHSRVFRAGPMSCW
jgi:hypothetical protein